jgi:hypothetical protein
LKIDNGKVMDMPIQSPLSDFSGSYHSWTSHGSCYSETPGATISANQASMQQHSQSVSSTDNAAMQVTAQKQRYQSTLSWVKQQATITQRSQMTLAKQFLSSLGRYAELVYFKNPDNNSSARPEDLAAIAITILDKRTSSNPLQPLVRDWAYCYLADKFHRRGIHHFLSHEGGRLPIHQPPEKFGLDTPALRSADGKFFQVPSRLSDEDIQILRDLGMQPDVKNLINENYRGKLQIARQRGVLGENGRPTKRYVISKKYHTATLEEMAHAHNAALIIYYLPHTPRFSALRSNVNLSVTRYQFSDLAPYGDLQYLTNDIDASDLSQQEKDKVMQSFAKQAIETMHELFSAPVPVYPDDFKLENLLLLNSGLVSPCDLDGAHIQNDLCTDPEATIGFQDPNIYFKDRQVYARDAAKYSLGATLYVLATGEDPPGSHDPNWEGYQNLVIENMPATIKDIAMLLMQQNPALRPELDDLLSDERFSVALLSSYSPEELAGIARRVHRSVPKKNQEAAG